MADNRHKASFLGNVGILKKLLVVVTQLFKSWKSLNCVLKKLQENLQEKNSSSSYQEQCLGSRSNHKGACENLGEVWNISYLDFGVGYTTVCIYSQVHWNWFNTWTQWDLLYTNYTII